jgi:hypothetical protein
MFNIQFEVEDDFDQMFLNDEEEQQREFLWSEVMNEVMEDEGED